MTHIKLKMYVNIIYFTFDFYVFHSLSVVNTQRQDRNNDRRNDIPYFHIFIMQPSFRVSIFVASSKILLISNFKFSVHGSKILFLQLEYYQIVCNIVKNTSTHYNFFPSLDSLILLYHVIV